MTTQSAFTILVLLVALQRLVELRVSRRNERALRARGAREHASAQMPFMVATHTGWLVAMLIEVWWRDPPVHWLLALLSFGVFVLGQSLRIAAMRALGGRWTVRVLTLPEPPVTRGVFRYLRHPNYLGVVLEIVALPLIHGAYLTALVFTIANAILLSFRIRAEERALAESSDYEERFRGRPRMVPRGT